MRRTCSLFLLSLLLPTAATAQLLAEFVSAHPERITPDGAFLLLIKDRWTDGCRGTVEVDVTEQRVEVTGILASPSLQTACTQAVVPFEEIVNVRSIAPDVRFADPVTVSYRFDAGSGAEERMTINVSVDDAPLPGTTVQNGSWVTESLESSGLFIDQQGEILTAFLAEYTTDGLPVWHYASGRVEGSAFSAPMQRFSEIECVTSPCSRVALDREGRIDMVLLGRDALTVDYEGVLEGRGAAIEDALAYERLRFTRSEELEDLPLRVPDLVGEWVAGVHRGAGTSGAYLSVRIDLDRVNDATGATPAVVFVATDLGSLDAEPAPTFEIVCADNRAFDGFESCQVVGFPSSGGSCAASFLFREVGVDRVSARASCEGDPGFDSRFDLFRLD